MRPCIPLRPLRLARQRRVCVVVAAVVLTLFPLSVVSAQPVAPNGTWLRQLIDLRAHQGVCRLVLSGVGKADVFFNGQRLATGQLLEGQPVAWDVSLLTRGQRNSVAIHWEQTGAPLSVSLATDDAWLPTPDRWKQAPEPPPIGWQTTDFNDRDWKAIAGQVKPPPQVPLSDVTPLEWRSARTAERIVDGRLQLQPNDHVVLLGGTFIERAQSFGYLELALRIPSPAGTTFRNLGWSADTVFAESRGIFDPVEKGYERMIEHVRAEEPDVLLVCYGQNEAMSFAGDQAGRDRFSAQLLKLIADLKTTGAEIVLLSPHPFLDVDRPYPSPARWNDQLQQIGRRVQDVANQQGLLFVDLFADFVSDMADVAPAGNQWLTDYSEHPDLQRMQFDEWTDNGMHLTAEGYRRASFVLAERLLGEGEDVLVAAAFSDGEYRQPDQISAHNVRVLLEPVEVELLVETDTLPDVTAETSLGSKVAVPLDVTTRDGKRYAIGRVNPAADRLRELIVRKNELYFHRWRPQNITYLFGFRKHEQGNNAREIAQFDPLVQQLEAEISRLCRPYTLTVSVSPVSEKE